MDTDNQPTPDDGYRRAWKQAFDQAAETPPPRIWNAIDRQLNTDDRARVVPLWWAQVRPWATGMAATVAVVLIGWWMGQKLIPNEPAAGLATHTPGTLAARTAKIAQPDNKPALNGLSNAPTLTKPGVATTENPQVAHRPAQTRPISGNLAAIRLHQTTHDPLSGAESNLPARSAIAVPAFIRREHLIGNALPALAALGQTSSVVQATTAEFRPSDAADRFTLSVEELSGKPLSAHQLPIQRVVWFRNADPLTTESARSAPGGRDTWASVTIMPLAFDPAVAVHLQPTASLGSPYLTNTSYAPAKAAPVLRSESGPALAVQVGAGIQLSARWSVETAVGYLQAQSTVASPVQVIPGAVSGSFNQTLYTAIVQSNLNRKSPVALVNNNTADKLSLISTALYASQTQGRTRNDYSFVQVPVQVGYQLRPRRKLGLSLLGGLLTNWFVRNTVGETLVVKPSDNVYRSLTLSGIAGARFRYRSSHRWSASLAGIYQQSLQLSTQSDASLETRPHTVGVSFGMDYHF